MQLPDLLSITGFPMELPPIAIRVLGKLVLLLDGFFLSITFPAWLVKAAWLATQLGSTIPVAIMASAIYMKTRDTRTLLSFSLLLLLVLMLKFSTMRQRPDNPFIRDRLSFPSSHAAFSMLIGLWMLEIIRKAERGREGRRKRGEERGGKKSGKVFSWAAKALAVIYPAAIGLTRVVMKVHHFSDVLAGWVIGWGVFVLTRKISH